MELAAKRIQQLREYRASSTTLLAANVFPLLCVWLLGWDALQTILSYWVELVVIGLVTMLKIITCHPDPSAVDRGKLKSYEQDAWSAAIRARPGVSRSALSQAITSLFEVFAFAIPYAFCCFVLLMTTLYVFGAGQDVGEGDFQIAADDLHQLNFAYLAWSALGFGISHLHSFFVNYLASGEYQRTVATLLMLQPYGRATLLYGALLAGAWLSTLVGENLGVLTLLIVGKTILDLRLHLDQRMRSVRALP